MRILVTVAALALAGCAADSRDIAREQLAAAEKPMGAQANALDNPMHVAHAGKSAPVACTSCHEITASGYEPPKPERCLACHPRNEQAVHDKHLPCSDCHAFGPGDERAAEDCISCHAEKQDKVAALAVHTERNCQTCHRPHGDPGLQIASCLECHDDHEKRHHSDKPPQERCADCHKPHQKAAKALEQCAECHDKKWMARATRRGHDRCSTCHDNKEKTPSAKVCEDCHKAKPGPALSAAKHKEHNKCINCHSAHDPLGTARLSCQRCHDQRELGLAHPADKKLGSCLNCHEMHPRKADQIAQTCSSCHKEARTDKSLHSSDTSCTDCHEPHRFKSASCASCHEEERTQAARAKGHRECEKCHREAHKPKLPTPACGSCHDTEYKTAPAGHKDCAICHAPHSGSLIAKARRCQNCHTEQQAGRHSRVPGGCESCHRSHGPGGQAQPQGCILCHRQAELPALHVVEEHDACSDCHLPHKVERATRGMCTGCHDDLKDHEPGATTCIGCHPFRGDR